MPSPTCRAYVRGQVSKCELGVGARAHKHVCLCVSEGVRACVRE